MTDDRPIGGARQDDYARWRQRLADKQAARRARFAGEPAPESRGSWDPDVVDLTASARGPESDTADPAAERVVDLRAVDGAPPRVEEAERSNGPALAVHGRAPEPETAPASGPPAPRAGAAAPAPDPRRARYEAVKARLAGSAARSEPDPRPTAELLRDLNRRRLEGLITDVEFKAQKAELFRRSSPPGSPPR